MLFRVYTVWIASAGFIAFVVDLYYVWRLYYICSFNTDSLVSCGQKADSCGHGLSHWWFSYYRTKFKTFFLCPTVNTWYVPRMTETVSWVGSSVDPKLPRENRFSARLLLRFAWMSILIWCLRSQNGKRHCKIGRWTENVPKKTSLVWKWASFQ